MGTGTGTRTGTFRVGGRQSRWLRLKPVRVVVAAVALAAVGCSGGGGDRLAGDAAGPQLEDEQPGTVRAHPTTMEEASDAYADERRTMVERDLSRARARPVTDGAVLAAMAKVPRHRFVPEQWLDRAYADYPLPIGHDQTISQPYIVALMTELLEVEKGDRVFEVGTGSGYQAAVLAQMGVEVFSIEIIEPLADEAKEVLGELGYLGEGKAQVRAGDGYAGWPEHAPFDAIIVTCAPDHVPQPLVDQLAEGGRMVIPVGEAGGIQELTVLEKSTAGLVKREVLPVRFVPMTGEAERR